MTSEEITKVILWERVRKLIKRRVILTGVGFMVALLPLTLLPKAVFVAVAVLLLLAWLIFLERTEKSAKRRLLPEVEQELRDYHTAIKND